MTSPSRLDRYQIIDQIGKGAMGVVYLAKDPLIGRLVALKTFHLPEGMQDKQVRQARDRFLREAQSAGILSHPNIVTIHDVVEESAEGVTFFAMEYVRGTNLKQMLRGDEPLDLPTITDIVWQVAEALQYAHSKGVVHRDIKPANILITADRRVKLTDFGIARLHTSDLTLHGQLLGTPNYMAPEQVQGKDVDHRADIFSLGVVLYELLTRHKPFQGDHLTVVTHRIVNEAPTPPEEYVGRLPLELSGVLDKALAKDPNKRFQRVGELARDLKSVCDSIVAQAALSDTQEIEIAVEPEAPKSESVSWQERLAPLGAKVAHGLKSLAGRLGALGRSGLERTRSVGSKKGGWSRVQRAYRVVPPKRLATIAGLALVAALAASWLILHSASPEPATPAVDTEAEQTLAYLEPLQAGHRLLKGGDAAAAADSFRRAYEQAPEERKARIAALRAEAERRANDQKTSLQRVADIESSLAAGQVALEERRYPEAAELAEQVLALDPEQGEAQAILASARRSLERQKRREERAAAPEPVEPQPQPVRVAPAPRRAPVKPAVPEPEPVDPNAPVTMTVDFYSQIPQGVLTLYADGKQLLREPFRFTEKTGFLRSKKVPGGFVRSVTMPPGALALKVYVALDKTRNENLRVDLAPGSVVNLEVRVSDKGNLAINLR